VTNSQLYLAIGVPMLCNGLLTVMVYVLLSNRISSLEAALNRRIDEHLKALEARGR
jgi:hypothetical protein